VREGERERKRERDGNWKRAGERGGKGAGSEKSMKGGAGLPARRKAELKRVRGRDYLRPVKAG